MERHSRCASITTTRVVVPTDGVVVPTDVTSIIGIRTASIIAIAVVVVGIRVGYDSINQNFLPRKPGTM